MPNILEDNIAYKLLETRNAYKYLSDIQQIISTITPILNEICVSFDNYTLHNIEHSLHVLSYMCDIAGEDNLKMLSDLELAMIIEVALLHDIGMWVSDNDRNKIESNSQFNYYLEKNHEDRKLALQDFVRSIHGKRSYEYILNDFKLGTLLCDGRLSTVSYCEDVALICQSHMESIEWIDENLKENFSKGDHYNSKYIALLLRIADYIDFDSQRAPQYLLEHKSINEISLTEWKKQEVICNFEKVDKNTKEIYFDICCSDFHLYCKLMDTLDLMNKEVNECVSYSKIFAENKYHLPIKDAIRLKMDTKGFLPERFSFSLDYHKVTSLLMGENLYGDRKYGFRELLQNCFDACNVMKEYYSINDPTINYDPIICIIYDYDNKTVVIKDNGIGMSKDIIKDYFLTIGKSYYRSDEYEKYGYKISPTGTFGIGFLSCFMLSKKVNIITKYYETSETSSFSLEKDSKYICYLDSLFSGPHGTSISLSMNEFENVFTKKTLLDFIDENFYRLDAKVNLYELKCGISKCINQAKASQLTRYLNINLSPYLNGVECRAKIVTLLEEFKFCNSFSEEIFDGNNAVLFTLNSIKTIPQKSLNEYCNKKCILLYSVTSFEGLISQTFCDLESYDFDVDELIDNFERHGFRAFNPTFDEYSEQTNNEWWINSWDAMNNMPICVFWDNSLSDEYMQDILQKTKKQYLIDIDALSNNYDKDATKGGFIVNSSPVVEDFQLNELVLSYTSSHMTSYQTNICYRGVLLSDAKLRIPNIANLLTEVIVVANITRGDFIPSVNRRGLTAEQEQLLSYAIGKAIHKYLIETYSNDKEIKMAFQNLLIKKYSVDNCLCK